MSQLRPSRRAQAALDRMPAEWILRWQAVRHNIFELNTLQHQAIEGLYGPQPLEYDENIMVATEGLLATLEDPGAMDVPAFPSAAPRPSTSARPSQAAKASQPSARSGPYVDP